MELSSAVQSMAKKRRGLQMLGVAYILFYVLAFVAALFSIWIGLVLVVCNGVFFLAVLRPKTKRYQRDFIGHTLRFGFCAGMDECSYTGKKEVGDDALYELPLLPGDGSGILCKEGFTAKGGGFTVAGNEISLHYKLSPSEKGKLNYRFVSGTLLQFTWSAGSPRRSLVSIVDRELAGPDAMTSLLQKGVVEHQAGDPAFSGQFVLLQPEGAPALPDGLPRRVKRLAQSAGQSVSVCLRDRQLVVFLKDCFYAQKIMVKRQVDEAMLQAQRLPAKSELLELARYCINMDRE